MPRQKHCPHHQFPYFCRHANISSQWKRRRKRRWSVERPSPTTALSYEKHHFLLLLLFLLVTFIGRIEGRDALRPDVQLEVVDPTGEAELLIEEAVGAEPELQKGNAERPKHFEQKKLDDKSVVRTDHTSFAHWHFSSAAFGGHQSDFFFVGAPSVQAHISRNSWERYQRFKEETCRKSAETDLAERRLNSTESAYFHWEENEFHRELRKKLLPQTMRDGRTSFRPLLNSELLGSLDPRLFVSAPKSLCKAKRLVDEADEWLKHIKEEKHMFEDFLINKVFSPSV